MNVAGKSSEFQRVDRKPEFELTDLQYWWVVLVSLLGPLAAIWIETEWVGFSKYQALLFYLDSPFLWAIIGLEFFFTMGLLIVFRRFLARFTIRWAIVLCFYTLWTWVAFKMMPGVPR